MWSGVLCIEGDSIPRVLGQGIAVGSGVGLVVVVVVAVVGGGGLDGDAVAGRPAASDIDSAGLGGLAVDAVRIPAASDIGSLELVSSIGPFHYLMRRPFWFL